MSYHVALLLYADVTLFRAKRNRVLWQPVLKSRRSNYLIIISVTETEDRIRHVERLNLFLENLFPADSNVTEYGYEFEKNIFKTQAAKSYIYPS